MSIDTSSSDGPDLDELAGEYVLGTLSTAQHEDVSKRMLTDPALRAAVQEWEARLLPLTSMTDPVEPSTRLWHRIERSVDFVEHEAAARTTVPASQTSRLTLWRDLMFWRGMSAAGFAVAAIFGSLLLIRQNTPPTVPKYMVVLVAPQDKAPGWVIQVSADRELQLIPLGSVELPSDRALQFWTKGDGWSAPISLGMVKQGATLRVPVSKLPSVQKNQLFELTLEPLSGSPTGRPSGPVEFIGRAAQIM
ncbi:anti-sigma factor [Burkholderia sp. PAMC 26561]|uniref:anti-sigma factor n=1 Tax=Burkholderia sp. PAMC 26561 TaxID=1795043 RepID=UPI00076AE559|nr:anti-sigma factor [Burkholderia sp. PAMC 26561]AME26871.1 RNA polymerase subunit sigma-70 [Burkholderia sp. PAMC 26561]AME27984.1 RNA polymerase subunit sigma-70 [Burkholderia sp. PAMC 26561]